MFLSGYLGLAPAFFPDIVPYGMTFRQAANADNALPPAARRRRHPAAAIVGYSLWSLIFRGKVGAMRAIIEPPPSRTPRSRRSEAPRWFFGLAVVASGRQRPAASLEGAAPIGFRPSMAQPSAAST